MQADSDDAGWLFFVRDNGIGFDPRFAEDIFLVFKRLHTRTAFAGSGIGLSICRRIVERHGGRMWADSRPRQGSTFYFTLPERGEAPAASQDQRDEGNVNVACA